MENNRCFFFSPPRSLKIQILGFCLHVDSKPSLIVRFSPPLPRPLSGSIDFPSNRGGGGKPDRDRALLPHPRLETGKVRADRQSNGSPQPLPGSPNRQPAACVSVPGSAIKPSLSPSNCLGHSHDHGSRTTPHYHPPNLQNEPLFSLPHFHSPPAADRGPLAIVTGRRITARLSASRPDF